MGRVLIGPLGLIRRGPILQNSTFIPNSHVFFSLDPFLFAQKPLLNISLSTMPITHILKFLSYFVKKLRFYTTFKKKKKKEKKRKEKAKKRVRSRYFAKRLYHKLHPHFKIFISIMSSNLSDCFFSFSINYGSNLHQNVEEYD